MQLLLVRSKCCDCVSRVLVDINIGKGVQAWSHSFQRTFVKYNAFPVMRADRSTRPNTIAGFPLNGLVGSEYYVYDYSQVEVQY